MRTVELARVAIAAETLYLRRVARRQALRGVFAAVAAVFGVLMLAVLHIVIYLVARLYLSPIYSSLIVLGLDIVVTGIFGFLAYQNVPDAIEIEARELRAQASSELKRSLTVMGMAAEVGRLALRSAAQSGVRRGIATMIGEVATRMFRR